MVIRIRQTAICPLFLFLLILVSVTSAGAQSLFQPTLDPRTYFSPSREYSLFVDPSDESGKGSATYRFSHQGKVIWEGKRPFSLWDAGVTDEGVVAGYAYSAGWFGLEGEKPDVYGNIEMVILDPTGKVRMDRQTKRGPGPMHSPAYPVAEGLLVDAANDRLLVRARAYATSWQSAEYWWRFRLSTGDALPAIKATPFPESKTEYGYINDVRSVAGTPLLLVHVLIGQGGRFVLIDPDHYPGNGKYVWSLDLPGDYEVAGNETATDKLRDEIRRSGAIVPNASPGQFTVRFVARKQQVTFAVAPDANGSWKVTERGRVPFVATIPESERFSAPTVSLRPMDTLRLQGPVSGHPSPIHHISHPIAAGPGRIAFVREDEHPALVMINEQGVVLKSVSLAPLGITKNDRTAGLLRHREKDFLLFVERHDDDGRATFSEVYRVNMGTGKAVRFPVRRSSTVEATAGWPDGGVVVLATDYKRYSLEDTVTVYDSQGREIWRKQEESAPDDAHPESLFSPESLTVLNNGHIAVLDNIARTVQIFTRQGRFVRRISLDTAWKRHANYPTEILADPRGGFVIRDFNGTPPVVAMTEKGAVRSTFAPRYPDGTKMDQLDPFLSADGRLWTSDSYSLFRLNSQGKADRRLGDAPQSRWLGDIGDIAVSPNCRILAMDVRTDTGHIFDRSGRWLSTAIGKKAREAPDNDYSSESHLEWGPNDGFLIGDQWFGSDGKPGKRPMGFRSRNGRVRRLTRRPDGAWLGYIHERVVAPNGALAIIDKKRTRDGEDRNFLSLYSPTDAPERVIPLPSSLGDYPLLAYDGHQAVLVGEKQILCYRASGTPLWQCPLPRPNGKIVQLVPFLTDSGHTLCLFDGSRTLYRYILPDPEHP